MRISRALSLFLSFAFFFICNSKVIAQDSLNVSCTNIHDLAFFKDISKNVYSAFLSKNSDLEKAYATLQFTPGLIPDKMDKAIPRKYVTQKAILKFTLCNSGDSTKSVWFFPGFFYSKIQLYRLKEKFLQKIPRILPDNPDSIGFRYISLAAKDTATFLAELVFVKTYTNSLTPHLIQSDYLNSYVSEMHHRYNTGDTITYVFCGLFLMMVIFSITNFLLGFDPEFLYYSGYAFFIGLLLFTKAVLNRHASHFSFFLEAYLDFILQGIGIIFYMLFMRKFLETKTRYRFLYHFYNTGILLLLFSMAAYSYSHYFTDNFLLENRIEDLTKILLILMIPIFLVYGGLHWKDRMLRYLFWGNFFLFLFSLLSQSIILFRNMLPGNAGIFISALFYYEIGLFMELALFLMALNYKNRKRIIDETRQVEQLETENQKKEFEKEIAVLKAQQEERDRISSDMHDELGSGVTAIRLFSEIMRNRMKENTPAEIIKISQSANELLNKMNDIIWSMNSSNDELSELITYLRTYTLEYMDGTSIECKVSTPEIIPDKKIGGDKRRNIFLCVKETLNNILKHSHATMVKMDIEVNHKLRVKVSDNGVGIDKNNIRKFGNGLKNMSRRMENIGGVFSIENDKGTTTILELPL